MEGGRRSEGGAVRESEKGWMEGGGSSESEKGRTTVRTDATFHSCIILCIFNT